MRLVIALGGNALLQRGEKPDAPIQLGHVQAAARALAPLARDHELIICHGDGPQVGMLAAESEDDAALSGSYPLDVLVAETQGMIGYWIAQSLRNAGVTKPILSIVTQTIINKDDPAFAKPTKFVGANYDRARAEQLADEHGWAIAADGPRWRRVVASPQPQRLVEQPSIDHLLLGDTVLICGGGGGAPVYEDERGQLSGAQAVVDKDYVAALLAVTVHADRLIVLTDVPAVMSNFGTPQAAPLSHLTLDELAAMEFPAGSMAPKIEACRRFVAASTGGSAAIGSLDDAAALLDGRAGTTISRTNGTLDH
ncbi:carbamate kinase [Demequina lutea]|uniref:Carbamate kinase n=1 Tax=Demequina lutea TaxID=431489 RepID=A0A7Z0CLB7_9MICO|nr:carbamate kinase [Demequina lutea]NYI42748.1 carbamate kinase [Demequina lutea]